MAETFEITVNGVSRQVPADCTVGNLLEQMGLDQITVVALRNEQVVERNTFADTRLEAGDVLELVAFVRGG